MGDYISLVPILTSFEDSEVKVSAKSTHQTYYAWKAFNGNSIGDENRYTGYNSATSTMPEWLQIEFKTKKNPLTKYTITPSNIFDSYALGSGCPKDWRILASNTGSFSGEEVELHKVTNFIWNKPYTNNTKDFLVDNDKFYKYIRLEWTSVDRSDSSAYGTLGEIELFGNPPPINKTLILNNGEYKTYDSNWLTVNSTLPTQEQFITEGMDSLSPLLDRRVETLESLPTIDKSEILSVGEIGKVFSKTIDLKKYMDIRNMMVEVKK